MKLPELPKKYKRKEADITPFVMDWFLKNHPNSAAIEVKVKGNKLLPHQEIALKTVASGSFGYKIPDMGKRVCYDCFILKKADAFVVTCDGLTCEAFNFTNNETFTFKINKGKRSIQN